MMLKTLKGIKTKLLKSEPRDEDEFEEIQKKLDEVEFKILSEEE